MGSITSDMANILNGNHYAQHKVTITPPESSSATKTLISVLSGDTFSVNMGASWNGSTIAGNVGKAIESKGKFVADINNTINDTAVSSKNTKSSLSVWDDSTKQSFTLSLIFGLGGTITVKEAQDAIIDWTYPTLSGAFYVPPAGYNAAKVIGDIAGNCFNVKIGDWFEATNVLVQDAKSNIETIFNEKGEPMLMTAEITFVAFRLLSAEEFKDWFLK